MTDELIEIQAPDGVTIVAPIDGWVEGVWLEERLDRLDEEIPSQWHDDP